VEADVKHDGIVHHVAREAGCSPATVQKVMTAGLRALHKHAFCEAKGAAGAVLECYLSFGAQAAYHLGGILEEARLNCDAELPWSETLMRIDSAAGMRHSLFVREWLPRRSRERKALDKQRQQSRN
jgi:hypothetical protein